MIAENQTVRIVESATVAPYWKNKEGKLLRWLMGDFYIVQIDEKELVFKVTDFEVIK